MKVISDRKEVISVIKGRLIWQYCSETAHNEWIDEIENRINARNGYACITEAIRKHLSYFKAIFKQLSGEGKDFRIEGYRGIMRVERVSWTVKTDEGKILYCEALISSPIEIFVSPKMRMINPKGYFVRLDNPPVNFGIGVKSKTEEITLGLKGVYNKIWINNEEERELSVYTLKGGGGLDIEVFGFYGCQPATDGEIEIYVDGKIIARFYSPECPYDANCLSVVYYLGSGNLNIKANGGVIDKVERVYRLTSREIQRMFNGFWRE